VRGIFADWSTLQYMVGIRLHIAPHVTADDTYAATYAGSLECLNNGVTTVIGYEHNVNTPDHALAGAQGMVDSGVRGVYGLGMGQAPLAPRVFSETSQYRPLLKELGDGMLAEDKSLVKLGVAPVELFMAPMAVVSAQFRLAREYGAQLTLHCNAVRNGVGEIQMLEDEGLLANDIVFVHGNTSTDREYQLVAERGAAICAGVEVEIGMALGEPTLRKQREFGLAPTIGVDSVGCCGGGLVQQARIGMQTACLADAQAALDRGENPGSLSVTSREALEWATINGAKALGMADRIGSIEVGKDADLVMFRATSPDMAGWNEDAPEAAIITQSSAADIDTVMVAGTVVKAGGRLTTPDWPARLEALNVTKRRLADETRQSDGSFIPVPAPQLPEGHGW
jgi:cytosine/adenosine deaminase-related metal-dependent hydrolase